MENPKPSRKWFILIVAILVAVFVFAVPVVRNRVYDVNYTTWQYITGQ